MGRPLEEGRRTLRNPTAGGVVTFTSSSPAYSFKMEALDALTSHALLLIS